MSHPLFRLAFALLAGLTLSGAAWAQEEATVQNETPAAAPFYVACNSSHYQHETCIVGTEIEDVELVSVQSHAHCDFDESWGFDYHGDIWVDHGCRATFLVYPRCK